MKFGKNFICIKSVQNMLKIEAIIRSSVLHEIQSSLLDEGIPTFSVYQVQITGIHKAHEGWRNKTSDFIPKAKIEILCDTKDEEKIINVIQNTARTGEKGDGVIFTYTINKLIKIRTGEKDLAALK